MITYLDFVKRLLLGQLKGTAAVSDANPTLVDAAFEDQLLSLTNQGLIDISTRLPIIKKRVRLTFEAGKNSYLLDEANLGDFLTDIDDVFTNDAFLSILGVNDADDKNHPHDTNGHIITPSFNTLRFTDDKITALQLVGSTVDIIYQAKHVPIGLADTILVPPNLELALQLFVASLFMSHMNSAEHTAKGDKYFGTYLRYVGDDAAKNTSNTSEIYDSSDKFTAGGFV